MDLSAEQEAVVGLGPETRALVTAGAGTGKTQVLVARLIRLVEQHGLSPGSEVLVLSFSRAAVGELTRRLRAGQSSVSHVRATTFDSFATRLLSAVDPEGSWVSRGYDGRIQAATSVVRDGAAEDYLADVHHVLVDECQDVLDVRLHFVTAILERLRGGFTLLGDPAQAIFTFSGGGVGRTVGEKSLFEQVRERYGASLLEFRLSRNYRALTPAAQQATVWEGELVQARPDYESVHRRLESVVWNVPTLGDRDGLAQFAKAVKGPTAVLCRHNGDVLKIATSLLQLAIHVSPQRRASTRTVAAWFAKAMRGLDHPIVTRDEFVRRVGPHASATYFESEVIWDAVQRVASDRSGSVDVPRLAQFLRMGAVPDEITDAPEDGIVVSTVHRAKGLEFDNVVLVDPTSWARTDLDIGEETRVLYVALTRARKRMFQASALPSVGRLSSKDNPGQRWVERDWRGSRVRSIEITGDDVDGSEPSGTGGSSELGVGDTQTLLEEHVHPGDSVRLCLIDGVGGPPTYAVHHGQGIIGKTAEEFGRQLALILRSKGRGTDLPLVLSGAFVESVETVAGPGYVTDEHGLGCSGLWIRPRLTGLARVGVEEGP